MNAQVNVAEVERWASALGGAALAVYGIRKRSVAGAMIAAGGGALIVHGATGHRPPYAATGVTTHQDASNTQRALGGSSGVNVAQAVTIRRPQAELYQFWRDFERLPRFMRHLISVRCLDDRRSHWVAKAPAGRSVEWDAEIINELPNELIAWKTLPGADVVSAGSVRFKAAPVDRGTEVRVRLQYNPPGGKIGSAIAWMLGDEPSQTILEDLRRLKQLMEAGEAPTTVGQPRGKRR